MKKKYKLLLSLLVLLIIMGGCVFYAINRVYYTPNYNIGAPSAQRIYIYPEESWDSVVANLNRVCPPRYSNDLKRLIKLKGKKVPSVGSYLIPTNAPTIEVLRVLSSSQSPIQLRFISVRLSSELRAVLAKQLLINEDDIAKAFADTALIHTLKIPYDSMYYACVPNTYEVYWTTSGPNLVKRLAREYHAFWNENRLAKAHKLGLTPSEVTTIASIVQEESAKVDEYPMIAGLYINRLRKGMLLQADPTVKYAVGDFSLRRILGIHLKTPSPYNTYLNKGLPPTPIRIPSIAAIDGVLNAVSHDYLYMCAKADFSGHHAFARTYSEHKQNARKYIQELNRRGIR